MYIEGSPIAISEKSVIWKQEPLGMEALMGFQECGNVADFESSVRKSPYSLNYFWIDRYGDVAYYHGGLYPLRPNRGFFGIGTNDRRFPLLGTGKQEYRKYIVVS